MTREEGLSPPVEDEPAEVSGRLIGGDGRILSLGGLDYVGECIVDLERRLAENDALLDAAIERAKRRAETLAAPLQAELERRKGQVAAYLQQHRDDHEVIPKGKKTRELPSGLVVGFRKQPAGYRWSQKVKPAEREAALLEWLLREDTPAECVRVLRAPDLEAVKRWLASPEDGGPVTQVVPPGLEYIPEGSEEMVINVKEKKP